MLPFYAFGRMCRLFFFGNGAFLMALCVSIRVHCETMFQREALAPFRALGGQIKAKDKSFHQLVSK